jgi:hypothetical protein
VIICGDTVYDIPFQLEEKVPGFMWPSGNCNNQGRSQAEMYKLKKELMRGTPILPSHSYDVYDRYQIGKRRSDKTTNYEGYASLDWPPK